MLNMIEYLKMKKTLLKNFRNTRVYIETIGTLNTKFYIDNSKIIINKNKLVIANNNIDCTISLSCLKKIKVERVSEIRLIGNENQYIIEI